MGSTPRARSAVAHTVQMSSEPNAPERKEGGVSAKKSVSEGAISHESKGPKGPGQEQVEDDWDPEVYDTAERSGMNEKLGNLYVDYFDGGVVRGGGGGGGGGRSGTQRRGGGNSGSRARIESSGGSRIVGMSSRVGTQLRVNDRRLLKNSVRQKGRADRATKEQVLDPRTRLIIFKMLNRGTITAINGCISTGKEANVYHCRSPSGDMALKVFKTSILVFRDRDRYVTGEHRFRHGYCKSNPRKMVKLWAEKEMRNLRRLHSAGIACPEPVQLRTHVLLMRFLGRDGWPAPRLKDAKISQGRFRECYTQVIKAMRTMYQKCRLVHGDLSEYNILYLNKRAYIIDVSQSVEHDHPNSTVFLKKDVVNVNAFFGQKGVGVMSTKQLFDFVTSDQISDDGIEAYLSSVRDAIERAQAGDGVARTAAEEVAEEVFKSFDAPRSLHSITDIEKHIDQIKGKRSGGSAEFLAQLKGLAVHAPEDDEADVQGDDELSQDEDTNDQGEDEKRAPRTPASKRHGFVGKLASKEARKAHKRLVKEAQAEKRKKKMKKKDKKRSIKKANAKGKRS